MQEPYIDIKYATLFALTKRGDPDAIAPLEALLKSGDLSLGAAPYIEMQIDALKAKSSGKPPAGPGTANGASAGATAGTGTSTGTGAEQRGTEHPPDQAQAKTPVQISRRPR